MINSTIGKQVRWEKLRGKPNASLQLKSGFGCLALLEVGKIMRIVGDYGVATTEVKEISEQKDESILVTTLNSTYLLTILY